ncbi:hypothetical protein [Sphingomonas endolithica]|uniref:hypothetical protein n=1 Tax=Sphingomonas endolithica TaxID=2972485 RepID=UPI0021AF9FCA|nr:hypothetical protein [Sphingomonas sp. ZFBP2030]
MSLHAVDHPTLRAVAAAALLLASTACGATPGANAVTSETTTTAEPAADAAAPATPPSPEATPLSADTNQSGDDVAPGEVSGTEAPAARVHGKWKVIDAAGGASGNAMVGRTLSFSETALGWVGADGKVSAECPDPFYHIVSDATEVRKFSPAFKVGWAKFKLPPAQVGAMHVWECGDADSIFGPEDPAGGSAFYPVGTDRLVMNWNDGTVLLLRR